MSDDLIERLERVEGGDGGTRWYRNPDGPEAAARIRELEAENAALRQDGGDGVMPRLVFNNADAKPKTAVVECSAESVPHIMAWYGAYHVGDRYTVSLDGRNVLMDRNGEPHPETEGET